MKIISLKDCRKFTAGDLTILREILHPAKKKGSVPIFVRYSLAHATLKPGKTSLPHKLKTTEVYYILKGAGKMHINSESAAVRAGQTIYIPPDSVQFIKNTGKTNLEFLCIVDPAWRRRDEIIC